MLMKTATRPNTAIFHQNGRGGGVPCRNSNGTTAAPLLVSRCLIENLKGLIHVPTIPWRRISEEFLRRKRLREISQIVKSPGSFLWVWVSESPVLRSVSPL